MTNEWSVIFVARCVLEMRFAIPGRLNEKLPFELN